MGACGAAPGGGGGGATTLLTLVTLVVLVVLGAEITESTVVLPVVLTDPVVLTEVGSLALISAVVARLEFTADDVVESRLTRYLMA